MKIRLFKRPSDKQRAEQAKQIIEPKLAKIYPLLKENNFGEGLSYAKRIKLFVDVRWIMKGRKQFAPFSTLYDLSRYVKAANKEQWLLMNEFFTKLHAEIRQRAEASPLFMVNIWTIIENYQERHFTIDMTVKDFVEAYHKTLDSYTDWEGHWSLIDFDGNSGDIMGVYLGDTDDVERFYDYLSKIKPVYNLIKPSADPSYTRKPKRSRNWKFFMKRDVNENFLLAKKHNNMGVAYYTKKAADQYGRGIKVRVMKSR